MSAFIPHPSGDRRGLLEHCLEFADVMPQKGQAVELLKLDMERYYPEWLTEYDEWVDGEFTAMRTLYRMAIVYLETIKGEQP